MNREIKPREKEIVTELEAIYQRIGTLRTDARKLREELKMLRETASYGNNKVSLYALRLQNECWYVGMSFNVERRFKKHCKGKGAIWTKQNKPIEIFEVRKTNLYSQDEVSKLEDDMTLEYAMKYGSDKVRGGGWCQAKPKWPALVFENEQAH
jgi:predicted GIY-YIG superfamily endonuclease